MIVFKKWFATVFYIITFFKTIAFKKKQLFLKKKLLTIMSTIVFKNDRFVFDFSLSKLIKVLIVL